MSTNATVANAKKELAAEDETDLRGWNFSSDPEGTFTEIYTDEGEWIETFKKQTKRYS